jgi:SAM-dependent methyltransferase
MPIHATPKIAFLAKSFKKEQSFRLLDVGAGNHSPSKTKNLFPNCEYSGVDWGSDYDYSQADRAAMTKFYSKDLTKLQFEDLPDDYFDFIMMAHIIEHLHNGDAVIAALLPKLRTGGYIYIEYPGEKSTRLPSMRGSLNFKDDVTHVRVYKHKEVADWLRAGGLKVLWQGTRRSWLYVLALPVRALASLLQKGYVQGNVFWDLLGFAEGVYARKEG